MNKTITIPHDAGAFKHELINTGALGLTKLEYFAIQLMLKTYGRHYAYVEMAKEAVDVAEILIEELERRGKE